MSKKLSEMTLQELWQLFPIQLTPFRPCWKNWYEEERSALEKILPPSVLIHHIGSTAIGGILAKPIVDMLVEADLSDFPRIDRSLSEVGYFCMHEEESSRDYNKGYTETGFAERVFHLHLRTYGNNDELYFRDYLRDHPDIAAQYETLKISLWKQFEFDRDQYTDQKGEFIRRYTQTAREKYHRQPVNNPPAIELPKQTAESNCSLTGDKRDSVN